MIDHALLVVLSFVASVITSILPSCGGDVKQVGVTPCSSNYPRDMYSSRCLVSCSDMHYIAFSTAGFALYKLHGPI